MDVLHVSSLTEVDSLLLLRHRNSWIDGAFDTASQLQPTPNQTVWQNQQSKASKHFSRNVGTKLNLKSSRKDCWNSATPRVQEGNPQQKLFSVILYAPKFQHITEHSTKNGWLQWMSMTTKWLRLHQRQRKSMTSPPEHCHLSRLAWTY